MSWGDPVPPLTTRFQYSILDDPGLARFYPPVGAGVRNPKEIASAFTMTTGQMGNLVVTTDAVQALRDGLEWILGAPVPPAIVIRLKHDSGALFTLTRSAAARELMGGEPFWSLYRQRLDRLELPDPEFWVAHMMSPEHQVNLLYVPGR
jgi:hypothetical protein